MCDRQTLPAIERSLPSTEIDARCVWKRRRRRDVIRAARRRRLVNSATAPRGSVLEIANVRRLQYFAAEDRTVSTVSLDLD